MIVRPDLIRSNEMPKYVVTYSKPRKLSAVQREAARTRLLQITHRNR